MATQESELHPIMAAAIAPLMPEADRDYLDQREAEEIERAERQAYLDEEGLLLDEPSEDLNALELDAFMERRLERMADLEAQMAQNEAHRQMRIKAANDWCDEQNAVLNRRHGWLRLQAMAVAAAYPYPKGSKTRKLINGEFGSRKNPAKLEINDAEAALAFADKTPELVPEIVVKRTIGKTPLKQYAQSTGIVPDGCELIEDVEVVFVKAKGGR